MQERQPATGRSAAESRVAAYDTAKGKVFIRTRCTEQLISGLDVDAGISLFFHYRPGAAREQGEVLRKIALLPDANVVLAFNEQRQIVGYAALHPVSEVLRWGQGDSTGYYEFGAIEVSRNWRGLGLANQLVEAAFADDRLEDKIVISYELSWHWDLESTGLTKRQYRDLLYKLLSKVGFKEYPTDEGNIRMDFNNLFTARIGRRASPELRRNFLRSLFSSGGTDAWWQPAKW